MIQLGLSDGFGDPLLHPVAALGWIFEGLKINRAAARVNDDAGRAAADLFVFGATPGAKAYIKSGTRFKREFAGLVGRQGQNFKGTVSDFDCVFALWALQRRHASDVTGPRRADGR